jgi:exopolysaccharide production protein ExoQ
MVLFGIAMLLFIRSFVEIDIMNPYHVGSFLLYFTAGKLTIARRRQAATWLWPGHGHAAAYRPRLSM